jgi:hypothetical protein
MQQIYEARGSTPSGEQIRLRQLPQPQPLLKVLPHTPGKRVPFNVGHVAALVQVLHAEDRFLDLLPLLVRLVFIRLALKFVDHLPQFSSFDLRNSLD